MMQNYLQRLALNEDADERSIRRAYARELKQIDQEAAPAAFQELRDAYETALAWAQRRGAHLDDERDAVAPPGAEADAKPDADHDTDAAPPPHITQADLAFAAFCERIAAESPHATLNSAFWSAQLLRSLDDLFSIEARDTFEQHIAGLLMHGWRRGQETLLVAAANTFGWTADRRRLFALGPAGAMLDRVLEEHTIFSLQTDNARWRQSRLIARLRDPAPPSASELLNNHALLDRLHNDYGMWLAVITNVDAIPQWQQAYEALPAWRRKLYPGNWFSNPDDPYESQWRFNWKWLWVLLILGVIRMFMQFGDDKPKSAPAPVPRQQPAEPAKLSGDYLNEGNAHLERKEYDEAIDSYNNVLQRTPNNFMAWIGRGTAFLAQGDDQQAEYDFNRSAKLDDDNYALYTARGKLAAHRQQSADAIALYTKALALLQPDDFTVRMQRAAAYEQAGDYDNVQQDIHAAIRGARAPELGAYLYSIRIALLRGDLATADADVSTVLAKFGDQPQAYETIAALYNAFNHAQKSLAMVQRGLKQAPSANLWRGRAYLRGPGNVELRRADLARAANLGPETLELTQDRVNLELEAGNRNAAFTLATQALTSAPDDSPIRPLLLALRGVVQAKLGKSSAAEQDYSDALKTAGDSAVKLNNICWELATHNVSLPTALYLCNQALELQPDYEAALDSRGLVLLQMGRNQDALDSYNAVLAAKKDHAHALVGRGVARLRLGDQAGGNADLKAAFKLHPVLRRHYASYGIKTVAYL